MGQLGDLFREAREGKGLSLEQAEKTTKIRKRLLQALEQEAYEELPAPVFVKGFVRNYARFLELDPEQAIALYKEAAGDAEQPYELKALSEPLEEGPSRALWFLAALLVVLLGLAAWWGHAQGLIKLPDLPSLSLRAATATLSPTATLEPSATPTLAQATTIAEAATPTPLASLTPASRPTETPTNSAATNTTAPSATVTDTPTSIPTDTAPPIPTATMTGTATLTPSPTATWPPSDAPIQVVLISDMSAWLRVYADGEKVYEGMMEQGTTRAWSANRQLYVHCGYANGVRAIVNGEEYGPLGPEADTVRVEWTLAAGTPSVSSVVKPTQIVLPTATRAP